MSLPRLRMVELLGAVSVATDLGTGQPPGHGLGTTFLAVEIRPSHGGT